MPTKGFKLDLGKSPVALMTQIKMRSVFLDLIPFCQMRIIKSDFLLPRFPFFPFFAFLLLCIQLLFLLRTECFVISRQAITTVIQSR